MQIVKIRLIHMYIDQIIQSNSKKIKMNCDGGHPVVDG